MCSNVMENGIKLTATLESQSPMIKREAFGIFSGC